MASIIPFAHVDKALLKDSYSGVKLISQERTLMLPACYMGDIRQGITNLLNAELRLYSRDLGGVLIAYENVKLKSKFAEIMDNSSNSLVHIIGDFIVFKPQVGDVLKGIVNKVSFSHIGCIVNGLYNVSLIKPSVGNVCFGSEVLFQVIKLDLSSRVMFVRGKLESVTKLNAELRNDYAMDADDGYVSELVPSGISGSSMDEAIDRNDGIQGGSHVYFSGSDGSDGDEDKKEGLGSDLKSSLSLEQLALDTENDSSASSVENEETEQKKKRKKKRKKSSKDRKSLGQKKKRKRDGKMKETKASTEELNINSVRDESESKLKKLKRNSISLKIETVLETRREDSMSEKTDKKSKKPKRDSISDKIETTLETRREDSMSENTEKKSKKPKRDPISDNMETMPEAHRQDSIGEKTDMKPKKKKRTLLSKKTEIMLETPKQDAISEKIDKTPKKPKQDSTSEKTDTKSKKRKRDSISDEINAKPNKRKKTISNDSKDDGDGEVTGLTEKENELLKMLLAKVGKFQDSKKSSKEKNNTETKKERRKSHSKEKEHLQRRSVE